MVDVGHPEGAVKFLGDNQGALSLIRNPVISSRSKHIDVLHHFVHERSACGEISLRTARLLTWWRTC
jgi:hypothetical protein